MTNDFYMTLDCRDGQHDACETCSCKCHFVTNMRRDFRAEELEVDSLEELLADELTPEARLLMNLFTEPVIPLTIQVVPAKPVGGRLVMIGRIRSGIMVFLRQARHEPLWNVDYDDLAGQSDSHDTEEK